MQADPSAVRRLRSNSTELGTRARLEKHDLLTRSSDRILLVEWKA